MTDYINNAKQYMMIVAYAYTLFIYMDMLADKIYYIFCIVFSVIPFITYILFNSFLLGFFIQVILYLNCNPYDLTNDTKISTLNYLDKKYLPDQHMLLTDCNPKKLKFPIIIKPNVCTGDSRGIYIAYNLKEFNEVCEEINPKDYMIQHFLEDHNIEVTVLFEKYPWNKTGHIVNVIEVPLTNNMKENIDNAIIHPELNNKKTNKIFNKIADSIPNFYAGRFDIRVKHPKDLLKDDFKIVEVNSNTGMDLAIKDNTSLNNMYKNFLWLSRRLVIGFYNIVSFRGYNPISFFIRLLMSIKNSIKCDNWEALFSCGDA